MAENAKKDGVVTTDSGLQYEILEEGDGATPKATDKVIAHYEGTLIDGTVFDSSIQRGEPATFPVNGVIQGWQEVLQMMKEGGKWRVVIPGNLAYGPQGAGEMIGPNETLIFDIELIAITQ
jgi:FKBP-type peptidyl-prolyl cis-trans isomerase FklB